jgi:uncharacterized membrane protein
MVKKVIKKNSKKRTKKKSSQTNSTALTFSQRCSDWLTNWLGSWTFMSIFAFVVIFWIYLNVRAFFGVWDPYPYILLNFVLSCLAAIQAPIILMSQNRQAERDRQTFKYDYQVNRKAEREIQKVLKELNNIKRHLYGDPKIKKRKR